MFPYIPKWPLSCLTNSRSSFKLVVNHCSYIWFRYNLLCEAPWPGRTPLLGFYTCNYWDVGDGFCFCSYHLSSLPGSLVGDSTQTSLLESAHFARECLGQDLRWLQLGSLLFIVCTSHASFVQTTSSNEDHIDSAATCHFCFLIHESEIDPYPPKYGHTHQALTELGGKEVYGGDSGHNKNSLQWKSLPKSFFLTYFLKNFIIYK